MQTNYLNHYPVAVGRTHRFSQARSFQDKLDSYCFGRPAEARFAGTGRYDIARDRRDRLVNQQPARNYLWTDYFLWSNWDKAGRIIFEFAPHLLKQLQQTDFSFAGDDGFKMPFSFFYLDLSSLQIPFVEGEPGRVTGVYVQVLPVDEEQELIDHEEADAAEIARLSAGAVVQRLCLHFTGDYLPYHEHHLSTYLKEGNRGIHVDYVTLRDVGDKLPDAALNRRMQKSSFSNLLQPGLTEEQREWILNCHADFVERTTDLVLNCLLYLSLPEREVERKLPKDLPDYLTQRLRRAGSKRQREVVEADIRAAGFSHVHFVGRSFEQVHMPGSGGTSPAPHWRRGHWRRQPIGPGRAGILLRWIKPTIVNKAAGEPQQGRIYSVSQN